MMPLEWRQVRSAHEALGPIVEARSRGGAREPVDERSKERRRPAGSLGEEVGEQCVVAAEELVAALTESATFTSSASCETR